MFNFNNSLAEKKIRDKITSTCKKIKVKVGKINWTYKCHLNSVDFAVKNKDKEIAMVMAYRNGFGVIHFINLHKGKYIDNTWGVWSTEYEYYLIKKIPKEDFFKVGDIFDSYRAELRNSLGWYLRATSDETW